MVDAVAIERLCKSFGALHVLQDIDLRIAPGEFFGLLGPNGAGKTTLISTLAGLARADSGTLRIFGHDVVADYRAARRLIGVVPQELVFDPFFTVRETLEFQSGYFGIADNGPWIDEIIENLALTAKADANMRMLSGGMKRRVLIAQALVHRPPVIVLDEPTAGVDVELRQTLWRFVRRLNDEGHTIVLTTHYLEEAQALCGRIAMLKSGRIVALDSTANLLRTVPTRRARLQLGNGACPAGAPWHDEGAGWWSLPYETPAQLEAILADLRGQGLSPADLELVKPDLEDVFVHVMQSAVGA